VTDRPPLRPICLIGPPAAGNTTLAESLSQALNAPILRPRDLVQRMVTTYPATFTLFPRDLRGRVPDEWLGFALRVCLDELTGVVILENLPWDAIQLADLHRVAGDQLVILHLNAADDLVIERRAGRRYCPACYPNNTSGVVGHRDRCRAALTLRGDDERAAFAERLDLHRINAAQIIALATTLKVAVVTLNAADAPAVLASRGLAAASWDAALLRLHLQSSVSPIGAAASLRLLGRATNCEQRRQWQTGFARRSRSPLWPLKRLSGRCDGMPLFRWARRWRTRTTPTRCSDQAGRPRGGDLIDQRAVHSGSDD
jgi:adenylate kinase family enzyme